MFFISTEINPCLKGNGGCHAKAECIHVGPNKVGGFSISVNKEINFIDSNTGTGCVFRLHASAAKVTQVMDRTAPLSTCV